MRWDWPLPALLVVAAGAGAGLVVPTGIALVQLDRIQREMRV